MSAVVTLEPTELALAAVVGVFREVSALRRRRPDKHGAERHDGWGIHVEGAAAEMAVAKLLDRFWSPLASGNLADIPADIGTGVEVRSTTLPDGCLIVHPDDPDEHQFYLVITGTPPGYRIAGWLLGSEAKATPYWRTDVPSPAFFIPQSRLRDV